MSLDLNSTLGLTPGESFELQQSWRGAVTNYKILGPLAAGLIATGWAAASIVMICCIMTAPSAWLELSGKEKDTQDVDPQDKEEVTRLIAETKVREVFGSKFESSRQGEEGGRLDEGFPLLLRLRTLLYVFWSTGMKRLTVMVIFALFLRFDDSRVLVAILAYLVVDYLISLSHALYCAWPCHSSLEFVVVIENSYEKKTIRVLQTVAFLATIAGCFIYFIVYSFLENSPKDVSCTVTTQGTTTVGNETSHFAYRTDHHHIAVLLVLEEYYAFRDIISCKLAHPAVLDYYKGLLVGSVGVIGLIFDACLYDGPSCDHYVENIKKLRQVGLRLPPIMLSTLKILSKSTSDVLSDVISFVLFLRVHNRKRLPDEYDDTDRGNELLSHIDAGYFKYFTSFDLGVLTAFFVDIPEVQLTASHVDETSQQVGGRPDEEEGGEIDQKPMSECANLGYTSLMVGSLFLIVGANIATFYLLSNVFRNFIVYILLEDGGWVQSEALRYGFGDYLVAYGVLFALLMGFGSLGLLLFCMGGYKADSDFLGSRLLYRRRKKEDEKAGCKKCLFCVMLCLSFPALCQIFHCLVPIGWLCHRHVWNKILPEDQVKDGLFTGILSDYFRRRFQSSAPSASVPQPGPSAPVVTIVQNPIDPALIREEFEALSLLALKVRFMRRIRGRIQEKKQPLSPLDLSSSLLIPSEDRTKQFKLSFQDRDEMVEWIRDIRENGKVDVEELNTFNEVLYDCGVELMKNVFGFEGEVPVDVLGHPVSLVV